MEIKRLFILSLSALSVIAGEAQVTLTVRHKARARIVLADTTQATRQAARLLNTFIHRMGNDRLPVVGPSRARHGDVFLGGHTDKAGEDGFEITCDTRALRIRSGGDKGVVLGVAHLLRRHFDCDYFTQNAWRAPQKATMVVPRIAGWTETPAFRYRQTQSYGNADELYRLWFGLEEPRQMFVGSLWVHTFNRILPAAVYGKRHPEWYSLINGERRPGEHSQWCLTNEALFGQVCHQLDSIFAANPGPKMISISQNDGNNTNCHCDKCAAVDAEEGAVSGNYIRFLNKLAKRYPDKEFSTLAYLFTMMPPRHVKPLPNVNIMLCDIDCKREVPLTDNESGRQFMTALEGWSRISDNLFIWDYGINFDNVVAPFPNLHILQKNIQLFKKHHANMLFEQVNGTKGTDFAELRAYMIAHLMWNPDLDVDSLMACFMTGYYGAAGKYLYDYQKMMQGALLASGTPLWIYDSPITHKDGMLNATLRKAYDKCFDKAEQAVRHDRPRLDRVRVSRLPLQYATLEIARTEPMTDVEKVRKLLETFRRRCAEYEIPTLNERNNRPAEYCALYEQRFLPAGDDGNLAKHAAVTYRLPPAERYRHIAAKALTDGLYGGTSYVEGWIGWEGKDAELTLDLGRETALQTITSDYLHQLGAWVLLPKSVEYEVSKDGKAFKAFGKPIVFGEDRDPKIKFVDATATEDEPVKARYIKVRITTLGMCPSWHYGVGYPAWFFIDEVKAYAHPPRR